MSNLKGIPNKLIDEKSPYLLQHAYNPVNWYPWGEEAFAKARAEDKPVFLSIGYSTCHWCHVMERESFEDTEVAALLNTHYVAIKVDREERPDIDHIYMEACQAMTGQGGWPLTVIMTPDAKPFFAGTYFPKESKYGRYGLMDLLNKIQGNWQQNKEDIVAYAAKLTQAISEDKHTTGELSEAILEDAYQGLKQSFDSVYGGFGNAPKFPAPHNLMFLMRYWVKTGKQEALHMVEQTLASMRRGGIFDHLGYGFSRYSVDDKWLVPHFEKMLYDNVLLCCTYLEAYQITKKADFATVAEQILTYLLRDMKDEQGGFYSAEDADSEGVEGKFYVWTTEEIIAALGAEKSKLFLDFYDVHATGNFEHDTNILNYIGKDLADYAAKTNSSLSELTATLQAGCQVLYKIREKRVRPFKDEKILTGWNALTIVALAKAAKVLGKKEYLVAAEDCFVFISQNLVQESRLLARYKDGDSDFSAYLDDYAYLLWALLELYEASFDEKYSKKAIELVQDMKRLFWDEDKGGFFFTGSDAQELIMRSKNIYDGALPSGNSVAALSILRLSRMLDDEELEGTARQLLTSFIGGVEKYPQAYSFYLMALDFYLSSPVHIKVSVNKDTHDGVAFINKLQQAFLPQATMVLDKHNNEEISTPAVSICENFTCYPPITDINKLTEWVEEHKSK